MSTGILDGLSSTAGMGEAGGRGLLGVLFFRDFGVL